MIKRFVSGKLRIKLILSLLFSFAVSVGIFLLLQFTAEDIAEDYFDQSSFIENQQNQAIAEFKKYVSDNRLALSDHEQLTKWAGKMKYVTVYLFKDDHLVYSSDREEAAAGSGNHMINPILKGIPLVPVAFADTNVQLYMECFFEYKYINIIGFVTLTLSFICFICIMLFFINRKTSYIGVLENEIKILEGGYLDYPITVSGDDELSSLAQSINEMRKSFMERLNSEERARLANSELVTAMSHDLRTPLTALVGYLDIIAYQKYGTEDNLNKYIHNSREKAYQIKTLSDQLFEYFTVFNTDEGDLALDTFDGMPLIDQLIDEQLLGLQNHRIQFEYLPCGTPFQIDINLTAMRRVFDNLFSNITKYAGTSKPVIIKCCIANQKLRLDIQNHIGPNPETIDSTGIGMKTCEKIIRQHKGSLAVTRTEDIYSACIHLPVKA
ncbi:sensor histidine kinase [Paenibacillus riograndensis]|uniref:histidine kinase n=1 Tax=Paenibacillus riograndensis SBR5 TaxID=1073571 RepID=A0A0E4H9G9_9BACL|nr:HAMP domain-containing sensor histidine kinase [Paenibacillus riograndensis]CQR55072.1 HAMP domain protein [Paenibacillus riograndensis SBR5]